MKKIVFAIVLMGFVMSCGPKRMGCGPGRCENAKPQASMERKIRNV